MEREKEIIQEAKTNPVAFGKLYDYYYQRIFTYILRRTGDAQTAQDITSETFFKAMKALPRYVWKDISFSSWIYKIAHNEIINYYRKKKYKIFSLETLFAKNQIEPASSTDIEQEILEAEEELKKHREFLAIQQQLKKLPMHYQEVLALRYFEKKKIDEIGEIVGKKSNTIKSLLSRGIENLRQQSATIVLQLNEEKIVIKKEGNK